ncbi:MAG TPA: Clp protease N-terminal domain-containing protein [Acidimicrobiia bacterium]|nr:Clp protease N-terminal domain-containing protein [Acidimicrobiia bacterium]
MFARFGSQARRVIELAEDHARALWRPAVGPDHLLLALLAVDDTGTFARGGLRFDDVRSLLLEFSAGDPARTKGSTTGHLPLRLREVFRSAFRHMVALGGTEVEPLHLALALVDDPVPGEVGIVLRRLGVSSEAVRAEVVAGLLGQQDLEIAHAGPTVVRMTRNRTIDLREHVPGALLPVSASSAP